MNLSMMRAPARWLLAMALLLGAALPSAAVDPPKGWEPRSGDAWVDRQLNDINLYAERYREAFIDELVRYQGAPRELAQETLQQQDWKPGDLYYACALAQLIGQPCRSVIAEWNQDHADGWLGVGKRLGVAPNSSRLRELKRGLVASYERWGRPLVLDAELRKAFPDHGKAPSAKNPDDRKAGRPAQRG